MNTEVAKIIIGLIKERHPTVWTLTRKDSKQDDAGNRIYVHDDSIVWETMAWLDYEVLDRINEQIEAKQLDYVAEYGNSYEVFIEPLT
jgi:hypothetical protein